MNSLARGLVVAGVIRAGGFYLPTMVLLQGELNYFCAALVGIVAALMIALITDYYTSYRRG